MLRVVKLIRNLQSRGVESRFSDRLSEATVVYLNASMHHGSLTLE